jgi:hypothetical protein
VKVIVYGTAARDDYHRLDDLDLSDPTRQGRINSFCESGDDQVLCPKCDEVVLYVSHCAECGKLAHTPHQLESDSEERFCLECWE